MLRLLLWLMALIGFGHVLVALLFVAGIGREPTGSYGSDMSLAGLVSLVGFGVGALALAFLHWRTLVDTFAGLAQALRRGR
jgi:hypothetical protein